MKESEVARTMKDRPGGTAAGELTPRGQRTRDSLVAAARKVFERDGFLDARITDISEAAGVAHGTFYTYFDSKEEAFREVILSLQIEMLGREAAEPIPHDDPWRSIEVANDRYLESYRRHSRLMVTWEQVATFNPEMTGLLHESKLAFVSRAQRTIERLQDEGWADPAIDARYAAHALTGMVSRFAYAWFTQGDRFEHDEAVRQLTMLWANAIGLRERPVAVAAKANGTAAKRTRAKR
jgi:AcrR family transcriptional regulator